MSLSFVLIIISAILSKQDAPCWRIAPRLPKCRECWNALPIGQQRENERPKCRFYNFRRLVTTKSGQLAVAGFLDPFMSVFLFFFLNSAFHFLSFLLIDVFVVHFRDASEEDLSLWLPQPEKSIQELDENTSLFLLVQMADKFCSIVQTEKEAKDEIGGCTTQQIAWKRAVEGVCVMCDVCKTTLFNFHWTCEKCGTVVCIDCYESRKAAKSPSGIKDDKKKVLVPLLAPYSLLLTYNLYLHLKLFPQDEKLDRYGWLFCTSRSGHDPDKLMPTQIIAGKALKHMNLLVHSYQKQWNVDQYCDCPKSTANGGVGSENGDNQTDPDLKIPNVWTGVALSEEKIMAEFNKLYGKGEVAGNGSDSESDSDEEEGLTLREIILRARKDWGQNTKQTTVPVTKQKRMETVEDIVSCVIEHEKALANTPSVADAILGKETNEEQDNVVDVGHLTRRDAFRSGLQREMLPPRLMVHTESSEIYPGVLHSWLCNGKVLKLHDPSNIKNYEIFQVID